jgi:hypothetical protein
MRRGEDEVWCSGDQYEGVGGGGLIVFGGGGGSSETWKEVIKEQGEEGEEGESVGDVKVATIPCLYT